MFFLLYKYASNLNLSVFIFLDVVMDDAAAAAAAAADDDDVDNNEDDDNYYDDDDNDDFIIQPYICWNLLHFIKSFN